MKKLLTLVVLLGLGFCVVGCEPPKKAAAPKEEPKVTAPAADAKAAPAKEEPKKEEPKKEEAKK